MVYIFRDILNLLIFALPVYYLKGQLQHLSMIYLMSNYKIALFCYNLHCYM